MNLTILSLARPVVICSLVSRMSVWSHSGTSQILDIGSFVIGSLYFFVNLEVKKFRGWNINETADLHQLTQKWLKWIFKFFSGVFQVFSKLTKSACILRHFWSKITQNVHSLLKPINSSNELFPLMKSLSLFVIKTWKFSKISKIWLDLEF